jgi:hypothetical protein
LKGFPVEGEALDIGPKIADGRCIIRPRMTPRIALVAVVIGAMVAYAPGAASQARAATVAPLTSGTPCPAGTPNARHDAKFSPYPNWFVDGFLSAVQCEDGGGISVQWTWGQVIEYCNGCSARNVYYMWLKGQGGDDCSIWEKFGPWGVYNDAIMEAWTPWHWQPYFVCGVAPVYNPHNQDWGYSDQPGVYSYTWSVQAPVVP